MKIRHLRTKTSIRRTFFLVEHGQLFFFKCVYNGCQQKLEYSTITWSLLSTKIFFLTRYSIKKFIIDSLF